MPKKSLFVFEHNFAIFCYRMVGTVMYKWNISNGSVEMIDDDYRLTREFNVTDDGQDIIFDQADYDKAKFIESHMTAEEADSLPETALLDIVVCILKV